VWKTLGVIVPGCLRPVGHTQANRDNQQSHGKAQALRGAVFLAAAFFAAVVAAVFTGALTTTVIATVFTAGDLAAVFLAAVPPAAERAGAFFAAAASFFLTCALDGKASATPFLAALERFSVAGAFSFDTGAAAFAATAGFAAPNFRRTGFSPQSSSRW